MKVMRLLTLLGFLGILIVGSIFFVSPSLVSAQTKPRVVRVGVYDNPPKIFLDEQGNAGGVFGDILAIIALKENWKLEFVPGTFQEGLDRVRAGTIDVMVDVAYSEERAKDFDFTKETVFGSWGVAYVRNESLLLFRTGHDSPFLID